MTLGKGLTGGLLPMSATLVSDAIYDTFRANGEQSRTFFHGHTFCGNPITSALALAALETYEEERIVERLPEPMRRRRGHAARFQRARRFTAAHVGHDRGCRDHGRGRRTVFERGKLRPAPMSWVCFYPAAEQHDLFVATVEHQ